MNRHQDLVCIMFANKDKKGHIKVSLTLTFKVNCQGHVIGFNFFETLDFNKVRVDTEILFLLYMQLGIIITKFVDDVQVEGSLASNFKVIHQGHVNYFSIFGFYDLNFVENNTNLITLSHLHQKISRLTNYGKNSVF